MTKLKKEVNGGIKMKGKVKIGMLIIVGIVILMGCYHKKSDYSSESNVKLESNQTPAIYPENQEQANVLKDFPDLFKAAVESNESVKDIGMYVIPGLLNTTSVTSNEANTIVDCKSMTPQGVTVVEGYVLISAYCHDHEHNSVLFVLDKDSHKYLKTIVLQDQPHAGGVTYDPKGKNIWVCGRYEDKAEIVAISLANLEKYDLNQKVQPIEYSQRVELPQLKRASVITYWNQAIYVGYFADHEEGRLETYPVDEGGKMAGKLTKEQRIRTTIDLDKSNEKDTVVRELQGITFFKNQFFITQSYGALEDSKLLRFTYDAEKEVFLDSDVSKISDFPAHAEQISTYQNELFIIFESAAKPYRGIEKVWVDRVLSADLNKLMD
ncbi:hypothetical protein IV70_GL000633 [Carnobacterium maltaromaticum DSM 20342]|nr:hypothetical protein IV70_GL000633 [Carnobacterium maltaromaticum DSM 20342]